MLPVFCSLNVTYFDIPFKVLSRLIADSNVCARCKQLVIETERYGRFVCHNMMSISEFERKMINAANIPSKWIQYRAILWLGFCGIVKWGITTRIWRGDHVWNIRYANFKVLVKFNSDQFRFCCTLSYIFKVVSIKDLRFDTNHIV